MSLAEYLASIECKSQKFFLIRDIITVLGYFDSPLNQKIFKSHELVPPDVDNGIVDPVALHVDGEVDKSFVELAIEFPYDKNAELLVKN